MSVRIIVCGGRRFQDRRAVYRVLDHIHTQRSISEVIQGECPTGADRWAREWAVEYGHLLTRCPLGGSKNLRYAEQIRTRQMLDLKPDAVVVFPGHGESLSLVAGARAAGVPVYQPYERQRRPGAPVATPNG